MAHFLEIVAGPPRVLWLPRDIMVEESALSVGLSDESQRLLRQITHPARRLEFIRARHLVRLATGLDVDPPRDGDGLILWPSSLVGSVSHSLGDVVVATAPRGSFCSVGVDLERPSRIRPELAAKICTPGDLEILASGGITLAELFAAKEALFKCHFPAGRRRFWFLDAELARSGGVAGSRQVALRVLIDTGPSTPAGTVTEGYVMAAPVDDAVVAVVSMTSRQG